MRERGGNRSQGDRTANPCPALGDDQHILVTFLILGGMILRFLFLMTFFLLARLFFSPFFVKIQLLGGGMEVKYWGGCTPTPGICSPTGREREKDR